MKCCLLILFLLAGGAGNAYAQTTQPTPAEWDQTVQSVAKSFTTGDDCKSLVCDECTIHSFDSVNTKQLADVTAHTGGSTLLMAKSYQFPDGAIAADIAAAVTGAQVSDDVKKLLVPPDSDAIFRANITATRWVQNSLTAANGDPVAVLLFFVSDTSQANTPDGKILFVMLKGRRDANGAYQITQIVYGDPQQAAMTSAR
jgi:hypothetical protein